MPGSQAAFTNFITRHPLSEAGSETTQEAFDAAFRVDFVQKTNLADQ
jgi:hypothetical protein